MESAIRLCYSPLPTSPRSLPPGATATSRASRVNLSLSHGFLSVSHCSKRSHLVSCPLYVNCMHERFSEGSKKEENDKKIVRGMGGVSLVLACVLGAFSLSSKMSPKSNVAYASNYQGISAISHDVNQSDRKQNVMSPMSVFDSNVFESLTQLIKPEALAHFKKQPSPAEVEALKLYAMAISRSGHRDQARNILSDEYEIWKHGDVFSESTENLKMALIELLLSQRDYQKANEALDELIDLKVGVGKDEDYKKKIEALTKEDIGPGGTRIKIVEYKALVNNMLMKKEEAKAWEKELEEQDSIPQPQDVVQPPAQRKGMPSRSMPFY